MKQALKTILMITLVTLAWQGTSLSDPGDHLRPAGGPVFLADNAAGSDPSQDARPSITIPEPVFTFGPVVDGTEVVHDFPVYNRGKAELAIEKVQTG